MLVLGSFSFLDNNALSGSTTFYLSTHSSVGELGGCFQAWAIMNNAAVDIHVWEYVFVFFLRVKLLGYLGDHHGYEMPHKYRGSLDHRLGNFANYFYFSSGLLP